MNDDPYLAEAQAANFRRMDNTSCTDRSCNGSPLECERRSGVKRCMACGILWKCYATPSVW